MLLSYDEIRQMNSCASCRAKHMTAAQLLDWSFNQSLSIYSSQMHGSPFFVWNDMFDPYHNAVDHYYYVEGTLAGSWKGLPASVSILNWNPGHLKESLRWFSGLDSRQPIAHHQVIAGYYDAGNGAQDAQKELAAAHGIPGIDGLMYTSWADHYSEMKSYAEGVRKNWGAYVASIKKDNKKAGVRTLWLASAGSVVVLAGVLVVLKQRSR